MTRDEFNQLALKACVNKMMSDAKRKNAYSPLLLVLDTYVGSGCSTPTEQEIALVRYVAEHPES